MSDSDAATAQELLRDLFTRLIEHVDNLTDGLADEVSFWRPTPKANSIAWLIWHSARVQDVQISDLAKTQDVWTGRRWVDRFRMDLPPDDTGYGHSPDDVAKVRPAADLLAGYYHAVHEMTLNFVNALTVADLERIIDRGWNPPVTAGARLVSIVDDCAQHLGQAAYVRGIAPDRGADAAHTRR
ncbi:MAG: mycothiol transferase [Mycolicibacterium sp.]|nr:mycothiol transferase [Mycolicibacterium sp.]